MQELSIKECVAFGWNTFKSRAGFFIGVNALLILLSFVTDIPQSLTEGPEGTFTAIAVVGSLVSLALSFLVSMGQTGFYLRAHDTPSTVKVSDIWHPHPYWRFVITAILTAVAIIIGLILLIVPGIIIGIILCFAVYIVMDRNMGPIEAMKESARITKGSRMKLFGLGLAILGLNILGALALLVGLLVSIPVSVLAVVHAYRTLSSQHSAIIPESTLVENQPVLTPTA